MSEPTGAGIHSADLAIIPANTTTGSVTGTGTGAALWRWRRRVGPDLDLRVDLGLRRCLRPRDL